jgi:aryl-alcohol dehydrogenase-like predicted oxidoreductase
MDYGIANRLGRPAYESVCRILEKAFQEGVNAMDTARAYGESEAVLGRALKELGLKDEAFVSSKVRWIKGEVEPLPAAANHFVRESVTCSLQSLGLEFLPLCLLHRPDDLPYLDSLLRLKDEGLVRYAGISVYHPEQALQAISTPGIDAIQCPTSVLDQRLVRAGVFRKASERGVGIFARSLFLQGLIALPEEDVPKDRAAVTPIVTRLAKLADKLNLSLDELATRFVSSLAEVTGCVVGMETVEQLESNLQAFQKQDLPQEVMEEIRLEVSELPLAILDPSRWSSQRLG